MVLRYCSMARGEVVGLELQQLVVECDGLDEVLLRRLAQGGVGRLLDPVGHVARLVAKPGAAILLAPPHLGGRGFRRVGHGMGPREVEEQVELLGVLLDLLAEVRDEALDGHFLEIGPHVHRAGPWLHDERRQREDCQSTGAACESLHVPVSFCLWTLIHAVGSVRRRILPRLPI